MHTVLCILDCLKRCCSIEGSLQWIIRSAQELGTGFFFMQMQPSHFYLGLGLELHPVPGVWALAGNLTWAFLMVGEKLITESRAPWSILNVKREKWTRNHFFLRQHGGASGSINAGSLIQEPKFRMLSECFCMFSSNTSPPGLNEVLHDTLQ